MIARHSCDGSSIRVVVASAGAAAAAAVLRRCVAGDLRAAAALRFGGILGSC
jgi:hypothetical protein